MPAYLKLFIRVFFLRSGCLLLAERPQPARKGPPFIIRALVVYSKSIRQGDLDGTAEPQKGTR
jgi:hypothetical protein